MTDRDRSDTTPAAAERPAADTTRKPAHPVQPRGERGGPKGPEPTRFGDWEKNGRCFDF